MKLCSPCEAKETEVMMIGARLKRSQFITQGVQSYLEKQETTMPDQ